MKYEIKELDMNMGRKEYDMYQDIPIKEPGSTNLCKGLPFNVFKNFLENEISKKYQQTSYYCTPTTIYIFYVNNNPIGVFGIRTNIDDNWKKWSGNFFYVIRLSERNKGYGTLMVKEALKVLKEKGFSKVYSNCSKTNIASFKIMEKNKGILIDEDENSRYYEYNI